MLQIRPQGGGVPYAPFRDLVNCFPSLARKAVYCLAEDSREDWFSEYLKSNSVTEEHLGRAAMALAEYINKCREPELQAPIEVLELSGFLSLPHPAQIAVLSKLGQVVMAMYYAVSRDALRSDEKPLALDALLASAEKVLAQLQTAPKTN